MSSSELDAPWTLSGEAVVAYCARPRRRAGLPALPHGVHLLPGPLAIVIQNITDSPVGPFVSIAIGEPARLGLRPGYFFGISAVSSAEARRLGRLSWGFPHELGSLVWDRDDQQRRFEWQERNLRITATVGRGVIPFVLPVRSLQHRTDGPVVVPTRLRSLARRAAVEVEMGEDDPLFALAGVHHGFVLSGLAVRRRAARRPLGLLSTFRAPLRAPEPGVAGMTGWRPGRALGFRQSHYSVPSSLRGRPGV